MDVIEAIHGALEAVKMDESPEAAAFLDALASSGEASLKINEDGSMSLKSGDASVDVPAGAISGEEMDEPAEAPAQEPPQ